MDAGPPRLAPVLARRMLQAMEPAELGEAGSSGRSPCLFGTAGRTVPGSFLNFKEAMDPVEEHDLRPTAVHFWNRDGTWWLPKGE
mmetsp:Transcript_29205/g.80181  ORF Transcript_29205/g.80181 Transcript_29205/m.80181 type:complete len:85 (-) Transcript_29205:947-1201(-)